MRKEIPERVRARIIFAVIRLLLLSVLTLSLQAHAERPLSAVRQKKLATLEKDAREGYDVAQYRLGMAYAHGWLVRASYTEAARWLAAAAGQGHVQATYALAMLYSRGLGIDKDPVAAHDWIKKLAESGHRKAQYHLGRMLETGKGVEKNPVLARQWYERAAGAGSPSATHRLLLMDEEEIKSEMESRSRRVALVLRAENHDARAQYRLGRASLKGLGVEINRETAIHWIMRAAEGGYADAQYDAAYLLAEKTEGSAGSFLPEWTKKAAEQGHPMAALNLGGLYEFGKGVEKDWNKAARWYIRAGGLGNANGISRVEKLASVCGHKPKERACQGFSLQDAAGQSDAVSLYRIGLAFKDGDGIMQRYARSLFWFRYAAGMGHTDAQYELGDMYENALGVSESVAQAKFWYEKAASLGHAAAAQRLKKLKSDRKGNG